MNKIDKFFDNVFKNKYWLALFCSFSIFFEKNIPSELFISAFIVIFTSIITKKAFNIKESLIFGFCYCLFSFIFQTGQLILNLIESPLAILTIIYQGIKILSIFVVQMTVRFIFGSIFCYITSSAITKIVTCCENIKPFFHVIKFFSSFTNTAITTILTVIMFNLYAYSTQVPIKINIISKLEEKSIGILNPEIMLDDENLLLKEQKTGKFVIYNVKKDFLITNCHQAAEDFKEEGYLVSGISYDKLADGNVFIRKYFKKEKEKMPSKAYAYIYSPKINRIIFKEDLPKELTIPQAFVQLDNKKILFISNKNDKKAWIYNLKDKTLKSATDTKEYRRDCKMILLKDGKVLVWGGYSKDNQNAEIYNISKNEFKKIPLGFTRSSYYNDEDSLFVLDDGRIVIKTTLFLKNNKDKTESYYWDTNNGGGQLLPYIVIFNPKDNSFSEIDLYKNQKYGRSDEYSISATKNGKIIVAGGLLKYKKGIKNKEIAKNFDIYDLKERKLKHSYGQKLDYALRPKMFAINNNEILLFYKGDLLPHKHRFFKIKLER